MSHPSPPRPDIQTPVRRAVFLDRDGVICRNRSDHVKSWDEFVFLPGALEAIAQLTEAGLSVVVVTNQAIINRHMVSVDVVRDIHARMRRAIESAGGRVDRVLFCPHRPDEHCPCRKPEPGLLFRAADEMGLDLRQSYLVGDAETDMRAGRRAGCRCLLVLTGRGMQQALRCWLHGERDFVLVPNLGAAVQRILRQNGHP
jgi:D-glycero-D-manno-heptose 1,7-bisphosphate phosphatase